MIAGGSIGDLIRADRENCNEDINSLITGGVDIWIPSEMIKNQILTRLKELHPSFKFIVDFGISCKCSVQVWSITGVQLNFVLGPSNDPIRFSDRNLESILENFDFTCCMVGVRLRDGEMLFGAKENVEGIVGDIYHKRLDYNFNREYQSNSDIKLSRVLKYVNKGFKLTPRLASHVNEWMS
jgi:hypothetical protein